MIPRVDYAAVRAGVKTEFRNYGHRLFDPDWTPAPVVGYCPRPGVDDLSSDTCLLTLDECWVEPLGAITAESLAREGFESLSDFKAYITERYPRGGYRPMANVTVYRVHPMTDEDREAHAAKIWHALYGQWA